MKDREIAAPRRSVVKRPDFVPKIVVDGQREQVGVVTTAAQQIADPPGAVADGVAAMGRRHPLVDDHRGNAL